MNDTASEQTDQPSPRIRRRQARTRAAILDAATERFAEKSVANVSVEEIIEAADVSRGTFYKLFRHKEDVLTEILRPFMQGYSAKLAAIETTDPLQIIDEIIAVYVQIWRDAPTAFSLMQREAAEFYHLLKDAHQPIVTHMRRLFQIIEPHGILRADRAEDAVTLMARSAVVVLRVFDGRPDWERLFGDSMRGLLLKTNPATRPATEDSHQ